MTQTAPPTLDPKHDADAIKVLDAILTSPAAELKERVDAAKAYFGARIAGDLRPRIWALEAENKASASTTEALLSDQAEAVTLQGQLKEEMRKKGMTVPA